MRRFSIFDSFQPHRQNTRSAGFGSPNRDPLGNILSYATQKKLAVLAVVPFSEPLGTITIRGMLFMARTAALPPGPRRLNFFIAIADVLRRPYTFPIF